MTDHQQAAIEAVDDALRADQWDGDPEDLPGSMTSEAEIAVEAAVPHLRNKWAEEIRNGDESATTEGEVNERIAAAIEALVEQQRIANLLSIACGTSEGAMSRVARDFAYMTLIENGQDGMLRPEIATALGIGTQS